ncbi:MAG: hypothetical protein HZC10_09410 [Nitrospirae bacterium]|nr:hypothetical protein [Nitrospirota bacterium]
MKSELILQQLEELAEKLSIKVSYDSLREGNINTKGGICRVENNYRILVDKRLPAREKVDVIARCISKFDLSQYFIAPEVRELIIAYSYEPDNSQDTAYQSMD